MSSPDGVRQVTVLWAVSEIDRNDFERVHIAYAIANAALARDCTES